MVTAHRPEKHTEETKQKIRIANTGRKHTEEELKKMRLANLGKISPMRGKHQSPQTVENMRLSKLGDKNPMWKGDNVGYAGVHDWARVNVPNPLTDRCNQCKRIRPLEVANVSGKYLRRVEDWEWLCRRCHMLSDGRMKNLTYNHGIY